MRNHRGTPLSTSSIRPDTNNRRKPAPAMPDWGPDPKSLLTLTHSTPKLPGASWCLFPARVGIFSFVNNMIKVLFSICTLIWRVNNYVSRQGKVEIGEMKVQL